VIGALAYDPAHPCDSKSDIQCVRFLEIAASTSQLPQFNILDHFFQTPKMETRYQ
jgi:hypothetical protein